MTTAQARWQLLTGRRYVPMLVEAARRHELPSAYVVAVASRETGIHNLLGDGGHGVGVIQIDIRYHPVAAEAKRSGSWRDHPELLIDYGTALLASNRAWAAEHWPDYLSTQHLKLAAAAYNAGRGGAEKGARHGDCDLYTAQHDYGRDVLARMAVFARVM